MLLRFSSKFALVSVLLHTEDVCDAKASLQRRVDARNPSWKFLPVGFGLANGVDEEDKLMESAAYVS